VKTTWALIDKFPPYLVRCLARRKVGTKQIQAVSDEDIAILSGIPLIRVIEIYTSRTWGGTSVDDMRKFCSACDFDPEDSVDRNRLSAYKNQRGGPKFTYLKKSPWWGSVFRPLILKFYNERQRETKRDDRAPENHDTGGGGEGSPEYRQREAETAYAR
jgi:hypothetical protein